MITKIKIQNFKSIDQLEIELGRINVLIGANGSGKSNLLEGIAMGAAGIADKLEHEFLSTRIRVTPPKFMTSAFETEENSNVISVSFGVKSSNEEQVLGQILLQYQDKTWLLKDLLLKLPGAEMSLNETKQAKEKIDDQKTRTDLYLTKFKDVEQLLIKSKSNIVKSWIIYNKQNFLDKLSQYDDELKVTEQRLKEITENLNELNIINTILTKQENHFKQLIEKLSQKTNIKNFLIFAPENHFLRNFNEESQLRPIGLRGEGLFNHIVELHREKPALLAQINEALRVLDWFDGFEMPNDLMFTEKRIRIKDNYLQPDLSYFDQRSANEGFLYLLFYFTLFISDETPSFFAIDNIDNAMNPKLGRHLVKTLAELAQKHQKQAILTTHNPAILDGLNLDDDEQRLFVIYRNADGQTKARRIFKKKTDKNTSLPLSEMFLRGYLGGLPNNF